MNIVISGRTVFIGKHLINFLVKKLPNVKNYSLYNNKLPINKNPSVKFVKFSSEKFKYHFINKNTSVIQLAWDYIPNYDTIKHKPLILGSKKFIKKF